MTDVAASNSGRQSPGTRAKDTDRNNTGQVLDSALADGQLSMEEHRNRIAAATKASTLGELQSLVGDLQTANAPVQLPTLTKRPGLGAGAGWGIRLATAAVLVLFGIAIGWGLYGNTSSPLSFQTDPGAKSDNIDAVVLTPPRQLHSLGGLKGLLEQMRQRFGDTLGYDLTIYPDYAVLEREDPAEPRRILSYTYRGGWMDSTSSSARDEEEDVLVDFGIIDVAKVVGIIRGAPETLGIDAGDVNNTYVSIGPARSPSFPGELTLSIYVSSELGGSGYIQIGADGAQKGVSYPS